MSSLYASVGLIGAFAFAGAAIVVLFMLYGMFLSARRARQDYIDAQEDAASNPHRDVIDMQIAHPAGSEVGIEHREMRIDRPDE